jgi:hypothetical protein
LAQRESEKRIGEAKDHPIEERCEVKRRRGVEMEGHVPSPPKFPWR